jgi:hypothetical protein
MAADGAGAAAGPLGSHTTLKNNPQTKLATSRSSVCPHTRWSVSAKKTLITECDEFDAKSVEFERLVATIRRVLAPIVEAPFAR